MRAQAFFGGLLLLVPLAQAADAPRVQVFSSVSRDIVAVGETLVLEVEAIVTRTDECEGVSVEVATKGTGFEIVRTEPIRAERGTVAGVEMAVLTRRFTLRPLRAGVLELPAVAVRAGPVATATQPRTIRAYTGAKSFYKAARSVLPVVAEGDGFTRIGSAFLVADDALVTAYHVVVGTDRVRVQLPNGKRLTTTKTWAIDPVRDIAVLHVDPEAMRRAELVPLALAPPHERGEPGDPAFTAGWPDGVQQSGVGVRYADLHPVADETIWVSSNRVRPGDSGGPLLDRQGRVLGVVTSGRTADGLRVFAENVSLATDPRRALALRLRRAQPYGLRRALDVHARAGARAHARVLELATSLTQQNGWRIGERTQQENALRLVADEAPSDPALQFLLGTTLDQIGDRDRAAEAYRAALDRDAAYFPAAYALGYHHLRTGNFEAAHALFEQMQEGTPYASLAALGLARIYASRLQYVEAEQAIRDVLLRDHHFAPALYLLGYCLVAQGRLAEAGGLTLQLERLDGYWAERLRLHVEQPILQPVTLATLPPVTPKQP
ncbi:MAG: trypsin-like peptidase domain-containing protein [Bacteroidota bacterium]